MFDPVYKHDSQNKFEERFELLNNSNVHISTLDTNEYFRQQIDSGRHYMEAMSDVLKAVFTEGYIQDKMQTAEAPEKFELITKDPRIVLQKLNEADWAFHI